MGSATLVAIVVLGIELICDWIKKDRTKRNSTIDNDNKPNGTNNEIEDCDSNQEDERRIKKENHEIPMTQVLPQILSIQSLSIEELD